MKQKITQWQYDLAQISDSLGLGFHLFLIFIFLLSIISFFHVIKTRRFLIFILCMLVPFSLLAFPVLAIVKWFLGIKRKPRLEKKHKVKHPLWSFTIPLSKGRSVIIPNPFRGIFIAGGAGAGKSRSLIEPLIYQTMEKNFTGLLYDYENPVLARHAWAACRSAKTKVKDYYINFTDLSRSHRLNPLTPEFMTSSSFAREYSGTILANLMPETIGKRKDFWTRNSESMFAAIIWFLKERYPQFCSLPHAVSMALSDDLDKLIEVVSTEEESKGMVASIKGGLKSDNQTAGILATIQNALAGINTPEIFWVLSGNDLKLDLNNPQEPKFLTVGNEPSLVDTYSPVISLILSAALKLMNRQGQQHSIFMVDELPTIYVPNLDRIPATARKNKIATVLSVQDYSQLEDKYGDKKAEVVTSVLSNQFFGNTKNPQTAERISRLYGKHDQEFITKSQGSSRGHSRGGVNILGTHSRGSNITKSTTVQERQRVKPQDIGNLDQGEFYISIVESGERELKVQFAGDEHLTEDIPAFKDVSNEQIKKNFHKIKSEVINILEGKDQGSDEIIIDW